MSAGGIPINSGPSPAEAISTTPRHPRRLRSGGWWGFVLRRLAQAAMTLLVVSVLIFAGVQLLPGNLAEAVLGRNASPAAVRLVDGALHLNQPLVHRYLEWAGGVLHGNFGVSLAAAATGAPPISVSSVVASTALNSLLLAGVAFALTACLAVALGVWAGTRRGTWVDRLISVASLGSISLPEFAIGTFLIVIFAGWLGWLPGTVVLATNASVLSDPQALVLPVLTLVIVSVAPTARIIRAGMAEAMQSEYVQQARLNGYPEAVVRRHAVRNELAAAVQALGQTAQYLVGGVVVVEYLFNYPGIGAQLVNAVQVRDIPFVESVGLLLAAVYVALNILSDAATILAVPKLRTSV
jgi:peptide/nickel transport system permease protein